MTTTSRVHWWTGLALLAAAGALGAVFLGPQNTLPSLDRSAADRDVLRVAFVQVLSPDPHRRSFPMPAQNLFTLGLWEPLVECDPLTGQPEPAAAQSWAWSDDHRTLVLRLRPAGRWSNGEAVTAHDFVRSWRRLLRQRIDVAQTLFGLRNAEAYHRGKLADPAEVGVRALDDLTLQVELEQVRSAFVAELADPLLAPMHASNDQILEQKAYLRTPASLVSNGPFYLTTASEENLMLATNPHYHARAGIRLAGVRFVRASNPSTSPLLLAAGVVDLVAPAPFGDFACPVGVRPVRAERELVFAVNAIDFNSTRGPLRDPRIRQALALALDRRTAIARHDPDRLVPAWSWVPSMPGRDGLVCLREDATEARRLLAEAGHPGGSGLPVFVMSVPVRMREDPYPRAWCDQWFRELGVKVYIAYEPPPLRSARMAAGDYDLIPNTLVATVPDASDLLSIFLWPPELSGTKWGDPEVVRLLHEANALSGPARLAMLEQAERRVMTSLPTVPTTFERRQALMADEVRGWYGDPLARQSLKRLWLVPDTTVDHLQPPQT